MPDALRLRSWIARGLALPGIRRPLRSIAGRLFGGYIVAFHEVDAPRFTALVDALAPDRPVHLDELVERHTSGHPTEGLFAITVDDGVGATVRDLAAAATARQWPITFFLPTDYLDDGAGMAFQWLDRIMQTAPRSRLSVVSGSADLTTDESRAAFDRRVRRLAYTQPGSEYLPFLNELVEQGCTAGWLSGAGTPPPVEWQHVAELATRPEIRFESHGASHIAVCALSAAELEAELQKSRLRIAECTGRLARHFCYPFGGPESIGDAAPRAVARYYESAVTMTRGRLGNANALLLPRIPLYPRDTPDVARLKVLTR